MFPSNFMIILNRPLLPVDNRRHNYNAITHEVLRVRIFQNAENVLQDAGNCSMFFRVAIICSNSTTMKMHFISYMNMNIVVIAQVFELFSKIIQNNNIENVTGIRVNKK